LIQKYDKSLVLGLEIKSLALVLVLKIMKVLVLVLTTKSDNKDTIRCDRWFALENWQASCQFNL